MNDFIIFVLKVCLLGLLVNMYIFKLSKTYIKILFQFLIYNLTLIFESFVKYFHEEILVAALFFLLLSLSLRVDYEVMETNSWKPIDIFIQNRLIHKNISRFYNSYYRLRYLNSSLWPIFYGLNYLIISYFSHTFPTHILINWSGIFKNQERFLFIIGSLKKTSRSICTGVLDREIWRRLWDPNVQKFAKFPQIRFVIFGLIVFKYFELSCN